MVGAAPAGQFVVAGPEEARTLSEDNFARYQPFVQLVSTTDMQQVAGVYFKLYPLYQQAYVDWIYRAYQGGLRLITCLAVNNEMLGTRTNPKLPTDDKSSVERQIKAMKQMIVDLDRDPTRLEGRRQAGASWAATRGWNVAATALLSAVARHADDR